LSQQLLTGPEKYKKKHPHFHTIGHFNNKLITQAARHPQFLLFLTPSSQQIRERTPRLMTI